MQEICDVEDCAQTVNDQLKTCYSHGIEMWDSLTTLILPTMILILNQTPTITYNDFLQPNEVS